MTGLTNIAYLAAGRLAAASHFAILGRHLRVTTGLQQETPVASKLVRVPSIKLEHQHMCRGRNVVVSFYPVRLSTKASLVETCHKLLVLMFWEWDARPNGVG